MKTQSKYEFQPYEISGKEVRFHWDVSSFVVEDDPDLHWKAEEALCLLSDDNDTMLAKIVGEGCSVDLASTLVNAYNNRE